MFLTQVGYPNFELVVFTNENAMTFDPIVNGLDPELQHIMYRLYRDATRYVNGHHTKDLSAINRDLKKVNNLQHKDYIGKVSESGYPRCSSSAVNAFIIITQKVIQKNKKSLLNCLKNCKHELIHLISLC